MTDQLPYFYDTTTEWLGGNLVTAASPSLPDIPVSSPPEFGGPGGYWTPEHLCTAGVNGCFAVTFLAMARMSNLELVSFSSLATSKLERVEGCGLQITEIVLKPNLVVRQESDLDRALRILEKAERGCLISNSMKATIRLEPAVAAEIPEKLVA
jgi:organic hydroperoxide reductase OsmC/OhrA